MRRPRRRNDKQRASRHSAAPFRCRLVVIAKAPVAGRAKSRLARQIGMAHATRFARQSVAALLGRLRHDPRWQTTIAVTPDGTAANRYWPHDLQHLPQGGGDLGRRMQRLMDRLPPGPVVIVGTDVPGITPAHIAAAFSALGRHDAVFGPAADGGYWLVGLRRRPRVLQAFADVRWSTAHALADTLANFEGRSVAFVATLADVDDASGYAGAAGTFARRVLPR